MPEMRNPYLNYPQMPESWQRLRNQPMPSLGYINQRMDDAAWQAGPGQMMRQDVDETYPFSGLPRRAMDLAYEHVAQPAWGYIASLFGNQQNPWAQAGQSQPDAITKASPWNVNDNSWR